MTKKAKAQAVEPDDVVITDAMFSRAMRRDELPPEVEALLPRRRKRGPQKAPTKVAISLRISQDVLKALRATGTGWQARVDEALREKFVA